MYVFGASGHGKVILEIAESRGIVVEGFIDNDPNKSVLLGHKVFRGVVDPHSEVILAIGNNKLRKKLAMENIDYKFSTLIHSQAHISQRANLAKGTVVMSGSTVNVDSIIGMHCIINTNVSVDHDCILEDFVHLSPNVALAGNVIVGEGTHIGIGACVIQGIKIGRWCTVGAGAVIIRDVPDGSTVVGNPGKIIKKIEQ